MAILILNATTKTIVAALSGAITTTNPVFTAAFADNNGSTFTESASDGALNGVTSVTLISAPAASTQRVIKSITIQNADTAAVTVTLSYNNNATLRTIVKVTLAVGDTWTTDGTFDSNGSLKGTIGIVNLATGVTGTLAVANGGTGVTASTGTGNVVLSTSPTFTTPALGTPASGTLSSCTVDGTNLVGFLNIPQNSQSAAYTLVLADAGKHIFHPSGDANARTYTIPANSSVAYTIGTAITFINMTSQVVTIAITTDTMYLSSAGTTGSRSLAQYGSATAVKMTSTTWLISGSGLT